MSLSALAARTRAIEPFYVMEILKEAARLETAGRRVIHMSIGEPDFTAPEPVRLAARAAIERGLTQYTPAVGIAPLRQAISEFYRRRFGAAVEPERIVITAGASGALLLAMAVLVDHGDEVLLADPSYPCNRHFVTAFGGTPKCLPCGPDQGFQLSPEAIERAWGARTRGVLLASPSNPTGTSIMPAALARTLEGVHARGGFVVVDEIYQGLSYDHEPATALALGADTVVINSFSKYFSMTGWRLGWLVAPQAWIAVVEKLAQNFYICPSAIAQHAALACFDPSSLAVYEAQRAEFKRRRDFLVPALTRLGFGVPVRPDGAFYVYVDVGRFAGDSRHFAQRLLHDAGVCVVPGADFGTAEAKRYVRVSYATAFENLEEAVRRIERFLPTL